MRINRSHAFWAALAFATLAGVVAAPSLGAAAFQGLQLEASISIDATQPRSEVVLDVPASAFVFEPAVVTVEDKPKKAKKVIGIEIKLKNTSDTDYYVYASATLFDADGKPIASENAKDKADDYDSARVHLKFKLPNAEVDRVKTCALRFSFEKD